MNTNIYVRYQVSTQIQIKLFPSLDSEEGRVRVHEERPAGDGLDGGEGLIVLGDLPLPDLVPSEPGGQGGLLLVARCGESQRDDIDTAWDIA